MFGLLISLNLLTKWGSLFGPFQDLFAPLETSTDHFLLDFVLNFRIWSCSPIYVCPDLIWWPHDPGKIRSFCVGQDARSHSTMTSFPCHGRARCVPYNIQPPPPWAPGLASEHVGDWVQNSFWIFFLAQVLDFLAIFPGTICLVFATVLN
jgi:hypothetical protein